MIQSQVASERIQLLNSKALARGVHVLYWMQQSQRAEYNHALEYVIEQANELKLPVRVVFGLTDDYPEANLRHYTFMLEGLSETQAALTKRGIPMSVQKGDPAKVALKAAREAALLVCDRGYLRHQKRWRRQVAEAAPCRVVQVESDVIVPVRAVSDKREVAARTLRPKIHKQLGKFLVEMAETKVARRSAPGELAGIDLNDLEGTLKLLKIDRSVHPVGRFFTGGLSQAKNRFAIFLQRKLAHYRDNRNQPQTDYVSHMSPYLHFGQISPLYLALRVWRRRAADRANAETYFEELVVRRELSMNFVEFTDVYDSITCLPEWAKETLNNHRRDTREQLYSPAEMERAKTHDRYWNAAWLEAKRTGYMHSYMRMYWAKQILRWTRSPEEGFDTALALMNKYFLDGRDANSYAGVAWVFGNHDRPFYDREVFGTVRSMTASGLERKADMDAYIAKVESFRNSAE
ncbi:MAG TPA: deoxyribodipyrimidine photo-lyase [Candidatus Binatia bacterium]